MRSLMVLMVLVVGVLAAGELPAAGGGGDAGPGECSCRAGYLLGGCHNSGPCPCTCSCRVWGQCRCECGGTQIANPQGDGGLA